MVLVGCHDGDRGATRVRRDFRHLGPRSCCSPRLPYRDPSASPARAPGRPAAASRATRRAGWRPTSPAGRSAPCAGGPVPPAGNESGPHWWPLLPCRGPSPAGAGRRRSRPSGWFGGSLRQCRIDLRQSGLGGQAHLVRRDRSGRCHRRRHRRCQDRVRIGDDGQFLLLVAGHETVDVPHAAPPSAAAAAFAATASAACAFGARMSML